MTSDDAIRAAERSGDRAALVLALVRAGRDASRGVATAWLEPPARGSGPTVLARTLDLVEPGDGECVLPAQLRTATV